MGGQATPLGGGTDGEQQACSRPGSSLSAARSISSRRTRTGPGRCGPRWAGAVHSQKIEIIPNMGLLSEIPCYYGTGRSKRHPEAASFPVSRRREKRPLRNRRETCALRPGLRARRRNQAHDMRAGAKCAYPPAPPQARARDMRETGTRRTGEPAAAGTEWNETRWRNESAGWGRTRLQGGEFDVATISPRPACGGGRVGARFRVSGSGGANAAIRSVRRVQRGGGARQRPVTPRGPPPAPRRAGGEKRGSLPRA